jgi:iron complex outermembrane receptor protein
MLKYRYKHIAKADIEVVYKKTSLGGSVRYNSFMTNIDKIFTAKIIGGDNGMIPGINAAREKFKDGDYIIDLRAGYQITETARLGFIINNLLNREYMTRPATMMSPRTFAMQLALKI